MTLPTFPARPISGGRLDFAVKHWNYDRRQHAYEPKWNGWRIEIGFNATAYQAFNRHGQPLSIAEEFRTALEELHARIKPKLTTSLYTARAGEVWLDCEGLDRRHRIGRGTLILLDLITPQVPWLQRRALLQSLTDGGPTGEEPLPVAHVAVPVMPNTVYLTPFIGGDSQNALAYYHHLRDCNKQFNAPVYEGIVSKRTDSVYPFQLRSDHEETPTWVKHRWPF